ncbi:MAG: DNA adenine methylase [Treponema sp.]|nr:DNA adenine methylase [Treponema sp.]
MCYPGVKSRVIKMISPPLPQNFSEFYEPFAGGGSVFLVAKQKDSAVSPYGVRHRISSVRPSARRRSYVVKNRLVYQVGLSM